VSPYRTPAEMPKNTRAPEPRKQWPVLLVVLLAAFLLGTVGAVLAAWPLTLNGVGVYLIGCAAVGGFLGILFAPELRDL
jgi:hypothetical protein